MQQYYIPHDYLCKSFKLQHEEESSEAFLKRVLYHLQNNNSLIIVDETVKFKPENDDDELVPKYTIKDEIVGLLVLRRISKLDYVRGISRISLINENIENRLISFKQTLYRNLDLFEILNCDNYLNYYYVCIKPRFRRKRN